MYDVIEHRITEYRQDFYKKFKKKHKWETSLFASASISMIAIPKVSRTKGLCLSSAIWRSKGCA